MVFDAHELGFESACTRGSDDNMKTGRGDVPSLLAAWQRPKRQKGGIFLRVFR
jgi:hypothetical protein